MSPLSLVVVVLALITPILADNDEIPIERAEQSSDYFPAYSADKALDGDFSSPAVTAKEENPWLRLYFTSSFNVEKVVIEEGRAYDVPSCTYSVSVYKGEVKTLCGTYTRTGAGGKVKHYFNETVQCGGKEGDSVMVEVTGCTVYLSIYEIKVYSQGEAQDLVNVALGGTATQSSLSWGGAASRAIDGNTNGDYMKGGSCTHTSESATAMVAPWWKVAFKSGSNIIVDHVEVFNRKDCCQRRIDGAKVYVAQKSPFGDTMRLCGTIQYVQAVSSYKISCKSTGGSPLVGHAVKIYGAGGMALTLCEVKVMAQPANDDGDTDNGGAVCVDKVMNCPMLTNYCTMSHIKAYCGMTCGDGVTC